MHAAAEAHAAPAADVWWQHGSDLLASLDGEDHLTQANPVWTTLLGLDPDTLPGRAFVQVLHPQDAARATVSLAWARTRGEQHFVARCRHARGHHVSVAWSLTCAPDGTLLASGHQAVPETGPSPALAGDAASARLQRVLAMGRLAGGIAHDFNNLLQAVRNALELVRRQPGDAAGVQRLSENALRVLDHGARLTAQLLASSGAQRLQLSAVAVVPLLQGMQDLLQRTLPAQLQLQMRLMPDAGSVMADPAQLESAVLNLLLNACDAMLDLPQGGVVTLCCDRTLIAGDHELPTGEYLRVSVSDGGAGMSDAVRERAFEPFFTTRPLAEGGHGRGLGLSQVHGFSRQCGGSTRIVSSGPEGTTVCMLLPVLVTATAGSAQVRPAATEEPVALVVADDDSPLRLLLCDSLRLLGYRAVAVADAIAVLAAMQRHSAADVVLIDMAMPGKAGHGSGGLARRLRLAWPDVGVVLVGGEGPSVVADTGQPVLQAPFDLAALSQAVGQAVELARSAAIDQTNQTR